MPLYVIERNYAERMEPDAEGVREIEEINADEGVRWVFSFLTADKMKSYCLYEASSPDAILAAAHRAGPARRCDRRGRSRRSRDVRPSPSSGNAV